MVLCFVVYLPALILLSAIVLVNTSSVGMACFNVSCSLCILGSMLWYFDETLIYLLSPSLPIFMEPIREQNKLAVFLVFH